MSFHKGDLVMVNPEMVSMKSYDHCVFTSNMNTYKGKVLQVEHVRDRSGRKRYILISPSFTQRQNNDLRTWAWVDEMLLPVQDVHNEGFVSLLRKEL